MPVYLFWGQTLYFLAGMSSRDDLRFGDGRLLMREAVSPCLRELESCFAVFERCRLQVFVMVGSATWISLVV
jgi:hypothetical protein